MPHRTQDATPNIPNELLKYAREQEGLSPNELAAKLTDSARELLLEIPPKSKEGYEGWIDERTVRRWESGESRRPDGAHKKVLECYFERSIEALGFTKKGRPSFWHIPQKKNELFIGRESILAQLASVPFSRNEHKRTKQESESPLKQRPQVLIGLPGIGKTQIAVAYAYSYSHQYHTIIMIDADPRLQLDKKVFALAFAEALGLSEQGMGDQNSLVDKVQGWFSSEILTRWLLIFDNVDSPQIVETIMEDFLPQDYYGHVLLISRMDDPGIERYDLEHIPVTGLSDVDGATLLLRRSGLIKSKALIINALEDDLQQAKELSDTLSGLPLALDQAGAYIRANRKTLHDYIKLYETRRTELLRTRGEYGFGHPDSVVVTLLLCFDQVGDEARELLRFFAFLAPDAISEELITTGGATLGPILEQVANDEYRLDLVAKNLLKYSLIRRLAREKLFVVHRLVQAVVQDELDEATKRMWIERVAQVVNRLFPGFIPEAGSIVPLQRLLVGLPIERTYLPHALVCKLYAEQLGVMSPEISELALKTNTLLTSMLLKAEWWNRALVFFRSIEAVAENTINGFYKLSAWLIDLAKLQEKLGDDASAQTSYDFAQKNLHFGLQLAARATKEVPAVRDTPGEWAGLSEIENSYTEVESRYTETELRPSQTFGFLQDIYSTVFDPDAILNQEKRNELARFLSDRHIRSQIESAYQQMLVFTQEVYGKESPQVATALTALVKQRLFFGELSEAASLLQRALEIRLKAFGDKHPDVGESYNLIAQFLKLEGRDEQAEDFYKRAIVIGKETLGEEHPRVGDWLHDLGEFYYEQERYREAIIYILNAIGILLKQLKPNISSQA